MPWTWQRSYLEGLEADGTISTGRPDEEAGEGLPSPAEGGPQVRQAQAGSDVIDLAGMRAELDRRRGGDR